jgi:HSP20 family protein
MSKRKPSFFERLTGGISLDELNEHEDDLDIDEMTEVPVHTDGSLDSWEEEGELSIDMYQTPTEVVLQTMTAGVRPEELDIEISRDMITIQGKRKESRMIDEDDYVMRELYWGSFSRSVALPEEVDPDLAEASERNGLLIIRLPKIDKDRKTNLKIKSD